MTNKEEEFKKRLEAESKEREYAKWKKENDPAEISKENNQMWVVYTLVMALNVWFWFLR